MVFQLRNHSILLLDLPLENLYSFKHALVVNHYVANMLRKFSSHQHFLVLFGMMIEIRFNIATLHRLLQIDQCIQINMQSQPSYRIFSIGHKEQNYPIKPVSQQDFYTLGKSCRKAYVGNLPENDDEVFTDFSYMLNLQEINEGKEAPIYSARRIYQLYDKQFDIFSEDYYRESYLDLIGDQELPTFLSEFSMIDRQYIKTRFFTKRMNKRGFYQYFIRRNGQYHVEYIDDKIPVSGNKQLPLWGLTLKEPWKIIIMKAWIKEKKGIQGVQRAQPYQFIEAFGMPGYRAVSIKKELNFISASHISEQQKVKKEARMKFTYPGFITVGKTRDNDKVRQLGLKRNRAGYKITALNANVKQSNLPPVASKLKDQNFFKVQSQLPVYWVGEYSVVSGKIRNSFNPTIHKLNIEKEFFATYAEISNVFSKFYIWPDYSSKHGQGNIIQESHKIEMEEIDQNPFYIFELQVVQKGSFNLNIDLPFGSGVAFENNLRYPPIKYFMARVNENNSDKKTAFQLFDSDYVKGYHKSVNRFLQIQEGKYYIYVKIDRKREKEAKSFTINIHTNASIRKFKRQQLNTEQEQKLIKQTFYEFSKRSGIRCYVHKEVKDLVVYICNKFDQLGFSFISLYVHPKAAAQLAMNINRRKLNQNNIDICAQAHSNYGDQSKEDFKVVAKQGETQILVLEKINRTKFKEQQFPPQGTIDFYQII